MTAQEEQSSVARILAGLKSCLPSTTSSCGDYSVSDDMIMINDAAEAAALSSNPSSGIGSFHDVSLISKASSRTGSESEEVSPLPQQFPLYPSSTAQKPAKRRNPSLTWTIEELRLVSQMRQGMMNTSRRKRSKKPKDAPKHPLSAYNIFFKEERARILSQEDMLSDSAVSASAERKNVGFENLAKTIGARWRNMSSDEERAPYKEKAALDSERYKIEMSAYHEKGSGKSSSISVKSHAKKKEIDDVLRFDFSWIIFSDNHSRFGRRKVDRRSTEKRLLSSSTFRKNIDV